MNDDQQPMTREQKLEKYGDGPWLDEPDRIEWRSNGLPCLIVRGPMGQLCGYVGVPPGHPWHGKDDNNRVDVSVHGGLSFAGPCQGHICHVPEPGESDRVWWLGFDCAHCFDVAPVMNRHLRDFYIYDGEPPIVYRDVAYVRAEVEQLAEQVKAAS